MLSLKYWAHTHLIPDSALSKNTEWQPRVLRAALVSVGPAHPRMVKIINGANQRRSMVLHHGPRSTPF